MKKIVLFYISVTFLSFVSLGAEPLKLEVSTGVNISTNGEKVYYHLQLNPTRSEQSKSGYFIPGSIEEAYAELDKILPVGIQDALAKTALKLELNNKNHNISWVWDLFEKNSCSYLKEHVNYPCYFVLDFELFLEKVWLINNGSSIIEPYNSLNLNPKNHAYIIIILYARNKANLKTNIVHYLKKFE